MIWLKSNFQNNILWYFCTSYTTLTFFIVFSSKERLAWDLDIVLKMIKIILYLFLVLLFVFFSWRNSCSSSKLFLSSNIKLTLSYWKVFSVLMEFCMFSLIIGTCDPAENDEVCLQKFLFIPLRNISKNNCQCYFVHYSCISVHYIGWKTV